MGNDFKDPAEAKLYGVLLDCWAASVNYAGVILSMGEDILCVPLLLGFIALRMLDARFR